jgi:hypothetical protein
MKIILTEQQFRNILLNERIEVILNSLNESKSFKDMKKKIKVAISSGVAISVILLAIAKLNTNSEEKEELAKFAKKMEIYQDSIRKEDSVAKARLDSVFSMKVEACKNYMEYALKNQGYTLKSTKLDPEQLVKICDENDFSLPFTMAIANLESCFGANKRAQKTNSVFSVGSWDNGENKHFYSDPNESIQPFIDLIKKDYITGEKSLEDLLKKNSFVNRNGDRYASLGNYESQVKSIINRITRMYPILSN